MTQGGRGIEVRLDAGRATMRRRDARRASARMRRVERQHREAARGRGVVE